MQRSWYVREMERLVREAGRQLEADIYDIVIGIAEKALIVYVLQRCRWNQVRAAQVLGINRNTLRKKMKKYHIGGIHEGP